MALGLKDLFAKAKPAELRELRDALASLPPPEREVIEPDERRRVGAEIEARRQSYAAAHGSWRAAVQAAEERRDKAIEECNQLYGNEPWSHDYAVFRDSEGARLWAGRPPLVDELIARCRSEATAKPTLLAVPGCNPNIAYRAGRAYAIVRGHEEPDESDFTGPLPVGNHDSVYARAVALRELAEQLERWTRYGTYATEADLTRQFNEAYAKLPVAEDVLDVVRRLAENDPRCRAYLGRAA